MGQTLCKLPRGAPRFDPELTSLARGVLEQPEDRALRSMIGDWLEDRVDARYHLVRLWQRLDEVVASLDERSIIDKTENFCYPTPPEEFIRIRGYASRKPWDALGRLECLAQVAMYLECMKRFHPEFKDIKGGNFTMYNVPYLSTFNNIQVATAGWWLHACALIPPDQRDYGLFARAPQWQKYPYYLKHNSLWSRASLLDLISVYYTNSYDRPLIEHLMDYSTLRFARNGTFRSGQVCKNGLSQMKNTKQSGYYRYKQIKSLHVDIHKAFVQELPWAETVAVQQAIKDNTLLYGELVYPALR